LKDREFWPPVRGGDVPTTKAAFADEETLLTTVNTGDDSMNKGDTETSDTESPRLVRVCFEQNLELTSLSHRKAPIKIV